MATLYPLPTFAEDVGARDVTLLQQQLARAARADAELVLLLANGKTLEPTLDQKRGDAAIPRVGIDVGEDDEEVSFVGVGDPELAAAQYPFDVIA
jgi:hypothetical protein